MTGLFLLTVTERFLFVNYLKNKNMANYFKVNKKVAEYLNLKNERNKSKDGNYILWQSDMKRLGAIEYAVQITGAAVLTPREARMEFYGELCKPLGTPIDERFIIETDEKSENAENPNGENVSGRVETSAEAASDTEATETKEE